MELKSVLHNLRTLGSDHDNVKEPPSTSTLPNDSMGLCSFEDINFSDDENEMGLTFTSMSEAATPHDTTPKNPPSHDDSILSKESVKNTSQPMIVSQVATPPAQSISNVVHASPSSSGANRLTTPTQSTPYPVFTQPRFPGPAGLLPKPQSGQSYDSVQLSLNPPPTLSPVTTPRRLRSIMKSSCPNAMGSNNHNIAGIVSYQNNHDFLHPPWTTMIKDLDSSFSHSDNFTLAYVKKQAINRQLVNGKVAHLRVLVKSVTNSVKNTTALVKDETGEMLATVHMGVLQLYKDEWNIGCCIVLRQVSIISPTPRKHYLNITLDNIVRLYSVNDKSFSNADKKLKDRVTRNTVSGSFRTHKVVQRNDDTNLVMRHGVNSSIFTSVNDHACRTSVPPRDGSTVHNIPLLSPNRSPSGSSPTSYDMEDDLDDFFKDIDVSLSDI